jgi:hypothetical protein
LTTSQPDAASGLTAVGIAEASHVLGISGAQSGVWNSQSVDATALLVMYTYDGDATLDGKINVDDYAIIDFNVGIQGAPFSTASGDLAGPSAVPEPVGGTIVLGTAILFARRRTQRARL